MNGIRLIGALMPLIIFLLIMLAFRQSAERSALIALTAAVLDSVLLFGAGGDLLLTETLKGVWNAVPIIAVIWTAILLYEVTREGGAYRTISDRFRELIPDEVLRVLFFGWVVSSFLQSVTGFGVPVSVVAPILISMGIEPVSSVVIALLGQSWGNTFGTLAAAWTALLQQAELGADQVLRTALWTSAFLLLLQFVIGFAICWLYGGWKAVQRGTPAVVVFSLIMGGGQLLLAGVNQTICCFLPSVICLAAGVLMGKLPQYRRESEPVPCRIGDVNRAERPQELPTPGFHAAFSPYYVLIAICVTVLMIPPLYALFDKTVLSFSFPATATSLGFVNGAEAHYSPFHLFTNPGFFLLAAAVSGIWIYRRVGLMNKGSCHGILRETANKALPATVTVIVLIVLSRIMAASGMIEMIALKTASFAGKRYGLIAPFIGMLGTFITGSNVSSNIMFGGFQNRVAASLHMDAAVLLGAQTSGGAVGSMISPSKIILGTGTVGICGKDGLVMHRMLPVAVSVCLIYGILTLFLTVP